MRRIWDMFLMTAILWGCTAGYAWAYLDPGSGSYAIQVLIGLAAGLVYMLRSTLALWWDKLHRLFHRSPPNAPGAKKRKLR